ncbi:GNAT family N-acetyltransferase [Nocardia amamiensis]|uniref:GNAT family N-acetyltransferase n=1 Tax=Nocardia amamiensis TaxID=404578 RepID=A0ABS0CWX7_9NOCA|nr:GNAT family N-acetyltransferase [Nocardia amamiensis]MBF6301086.1 GNAT family N-acetyltransferase [Nocardia amamiensis]
MPDHVTLEPLDEQLLTELLQAAVADADPGEVMPVEGPGAGWNAQREAAFREFHRGRALADPPIESTYCIVADGAVVGAARLCPVETGIAEAGVWIGRSRRGSGIGTAVFAQLIQCATSEGYTSLFVSTTAENTAVLRMLTSRGIQYTVNGEEVTARVGCG